MDGFGCMKIPPLFIRTRLWYITIRDNLIQILFTLDFGQPVVQLMDDFKQRNVRRVLNDFSPVSYFSS